MKKFLRNIGLLALSALMCLGVACNGNQEGVAGSISVIVEEGGFGTKWLYDMAEAYEEKTGVKVNIDGSYIQGEVHNLLADGSLAYDIAMPQGGIGIYTAEAGNKLVDLTSVYDRVPEGSDKTIREMTNPSIYHRIEQEDGKIYRMNWADSIMSLVYNKSVLDEYFPKGYTLPRTTDELQAFCERIANDTDLYAIAFCPGIPYIYCALQVWWAQYEGYETFYDYYAGYYHNEADERLLATNGEIFDMLGRKKALTVASQLVNKDSGFVSQDAGGMSYLDTQIAFLSQGYKGQDMTKCVFNFNGNWLENEMAKYLAVKPQDFRMLKMPIISDITEKLEDKSMTDAKLCELIDAIDSGETSKEGVSEADFQRVKEARNMINSNTLSMSIAIPVSAKKKDKAKDFLVYMASEEGQTVFSEALNGLRMPYGYKPEASKMSPFVQSYYDCFGDEYIHIGEDQTSPLVNRGGLSPFYGLADGLLYKKSTPDSILKSCKDYFMKDWDRILAFAQK